MRRGGGKSKQVSRFVSGSPTSRRLAYKRRKRFRARRLTNAKWSWGMIPLVLNDDLSRLVQISLQDSVGKGGKDVEADVRLVQALLNNVPEAQGGPGPKLNVDGRVGPLTIGAITRFQRASGRKVVDGRIDPLGPTIVALGRLLNARGQLPSNHPGIGPVDVRVRQGLVGRAAVAPTRGPVDPTGPIPLISPTDWSFSSSSGVTLGASIFGVASMSFHLVKDSRPGFVRKFPWSGIGVGLSTTPVGLDISFADFPSFGLRLRQGLFGSNPMPEDDIQGPCTVYSIGANLGVGVSGTLCMFGAAGPLLVTTRAVGFILGMEVGIPGAGFMGFFGVTGRAVN